MCRFALIIFALFTYQSIAGGSMDVKTSVFFPEFPGRCSESYNLSTITGWLLHPQDMRIYVQNFTSEEYGITVEINEEVTVSYFITPDSMLDPNMIVLAASVQYFDGEGMDFNLTFFNSSIWITEPPSTIDAQRIFTYVAVIAVFGLVVFLGFQIFRALQKMPKGPRRHDYHMSDGSEVNEWLQGTAAEKDALRGRRKSGGKRAIRK